MVVCLRELKSFVKRWEPFVCVFFSSDHSCHDTVSNGNSSDINFPNAASVFILQKKEKGR